MDHARNMARPAKLARRDEMVKRFHLQAPAQLPVTDPVLPLVPQLDSAHGPGALVVEHAKPVKSLFGPISGYFCGALFLPV